MKKVLSVLLAFLTLLAVMAPIALADAAGNVVPYEVKTSKSGAKTQGDKITPEPVEMYVDDEVLLVIPGAVAGTTYDWKLRDDKYIVAFRVVKFNAKGQIVIVKEDTPSDLHRTIGDQMVMIIGRDVGNNYVDVTEVKNLDNDDPVEYLPIGNVQINIKKKPDPDLPPVDQNQLCTILKIWWTDLQWSWYYQIHPALKFVYFTVCDWFKGIFNTIAGWFS